MQQVTVARPPRLQRAAGDNGPPVRVNLLYDCAGEGCFTVSGSGVLEDPPEELFLNGFDRSKYNEWIRRLEDIRNMRGPKHAFHVWTIQMLCHLPLLLVGPCVVARKKENLSKWDKALRAWQDDFNRAIEPHGLFVKTRSEGVLKKTMVTSDGVSSFENLRHTLCWLTFAIGAEEAAKLKAEGHLSGDVKGIVSTSLGCISTMDEAEFCIHPCEEFYF